MLICLNYWIEDPWTGIWVVVAVLLLVCDPVAHPVYVCAKLPVLLSSQKLFGGLLGFSGACQNQCQQTCDSVPSIQTRSAGGAHRVCAVTFPWLHKSFPNGGKSMGQMLSKYKATEYTWVVETECLSLQIPMLTRAGILNAGGLM